MNKEHTMSATDCDILIIGAGPAGATAAALLASRGHRVTVLEKMASPHVSSAELLAPGVLPLLDLLGVTAQVRAIALDCPAMEFIAASDGRTGHYKFDDQLHAVAASAQTTGPVSTPVSGQLPGRIMQPAPTQALALAQVQSQVQAQASSPTATATGTSAQAWQVPRERFNDILLDGARSRGATVITNCKVTHMQFKPEGWGALVSARHGQGESVSWKARFVLDASGRDAVLAHHFKAAKRQAGDDRIAVTAMFSGVDDLTPQPCGSNACIYRFYRFGHGWIRFVALSDGIASVTAVTSKKHYKSRRLHSDEFLRASIELCPALAARLKNASLLDQPQATDSYCWQCERSGADSALLLGDAYAGVDPMFPLGVLLAMHSAVAAADTADRCLRRPAESAGALMAYEQLMQGALGDLVWFGARHDRPAMQALLLRAPRRWGIHAALRSVLAGATVTGHARGSLLALKACYYMLAAVGLMGGKSMRARAHPSTGTPGVGAHERNSVQP